MDLPSTTTKVPDAMDWFDTKDPLDSADFSNWHMYHCVCGDISLLLDCCVNQLPLRLADKTRVLDGTKHGHIIASDPDNVLCVKYEYVTVKGKRRIGYQYRMSCDKCGVPLFYKVDKKSKIYFIMKKALVAAKGEEPVEEVDEEKEQKMKEEVLKQIKKQMVQGRLRKRKS